jgi:serine/threonine-protein kinase
MQPPAVGEMVTQALRLTRRFGAGGMGTVWIARHLGLNCDVVVKFMAPELALHADSLARFRREAAAAAEVKSPHVVQTFDFGISQNGLPYIAMELLEGEDLATLLLRRRVLSPGEVAGVVNQVARALSRAHEKKIIHRDIKPENLFLCETGEEEAFVKVLDFGIAKVAGGAELSGTATGAMIGTAFFMSPEQVMGSKSIDHRTDLWSLGVVAFHALTGSRPFDGDTLGAVSVRICSAELPRPSQRNPTLSPAIDEWFARACARDPAARFPSARVMADCLIHAVGGKEQARILSRDSFTNQAQLLAQTARRSAAPPGRARPSSFPPDMPTQVMPRAPTGTVATTTSASTHAPRPARVSLGSPPTETRRSRVPLVIGIGATAGLLLGIGIFAVVQSGSPSGATASPAESAAKATKLSAEGSKPAASASGSEDSITAASATAAPSSSQREVVEASPAPPSMASIATASKPKPVTSARPAGSTLLPAPGQTTAKPVSTVKAKPNYEPVE